MHVYLRLPPLPPLLHNFQDPNDCQKGFVGILPLWMGCHILGHGVSQGQQIVAEDTLAKPLLMLNALRLHVTAIVDQSAEPALLQQQTAAKQVNGGTLAQRGNGWQHGVAEHPLTTRASQQCQSRLEEEVKERQTLNNQDMNKTRSQHVIPICPALCTPPLHLLLT